MDSEERDVQFVLCTLLLVVQSGRTSETSKGWSDWLSEGQSLSQRKRFCRYSKDAGWNAALRFENEVQNWLEALSGHNGATVESE
jgi:hypothetical protein